MPDGHLLSEWVSRAIAFENLPLHTLYFRLYGEGLALLLGSNHRADSIVLSCNELLLMLSGDVAVNRPRYLAIWRQRDVLIMIGLVLVSLVLGRQSGFEWLFFPFRLFDTFIHELSHGLATIITGGSFLRLVVYPDFSGMAWSSGGVRWFVTSAGYLGSALFGALLTLLSTRRIPARKLLVGLGIALGVLCLFFVRNMFGIVSGLLIAAALGIAGRQLPRRWANGLVLFLAVQMMLNALDSLLDLILVSAGHDRAASDAQIMAQATGVPALVWALLWSLMAIGILVTALCIAYWGPSNKATTGKPEQTQSSVPG
jgi:hypothetical protein